MKNVVIVACSVVIFCTLVPTQRKLEKYVIRNTKECVLSTPIYVAIIYEININIYQNNKFIIIFMFSMKVILPQLRFYKERKEFRKIP
jgi:hypothetical protein